MKEKKKDVFTKQIFNNVQHFLKVLYISNLVTLPNSPILYIRCKK